MVMKPITFFLVLSILGFALPLSHDAHAMIEHVKAEVQESTETDSSPYKKDPNDFYRISSKLSVSSIEDMSISTAQQERFWIDRRAFFLLPVFYQSNYVIENL